MPTNSDLSDQIHEGDGRIDDLARQLAAVKAQQSAMQAAMKTNTEMIGDIHTSTGELLDVFRSWQGAMKTLEWIGRVAKPIGTIAMMIGAVWGSFVAIKSGWHK